MVLMDPKEASESGLTVNYGYLTEAEKAILERIQLHFGYNNLEDSIWAALHAFDRSACQYRGKNILRCEGKKP